MNIFEHAYFNSHFASRFIITFRCFSRFLSCSLRRFIHPRKVTPPQAEPPGTLLLKLFSGEQSPHLDLHLGLSHQLPLELCQANHPENPSSRPSTPQPQPKTPLRALTNASAAKRIPSTQRRGSMIHGMMNGVLIASRRMRGGVAMVED